MLPETEIVSLNTLFKTTVFINIKTSNIASNDYQVKKYVQFIANIFFANLKRDYFKNYSNIFLHFLNKKKSSGKTW